MRRVVAVGAHPDDETAFAGGMLARYASEGADVRIVGVTRGEGGEAGDPPLSSLEELGATRERELRCAAAALGASGVHFLGFVDPRIAVGEEGRRIDATLDEFAGAILGVLEELRPDVVLTHGSNGEYGHPQHVFTNQAVRTALARSQAPHPELLTWCALEDGQPEDRFTNVGDKADLVVDITPWFDAKCTALACHQTQLAMIYRNSKVTDLREIVRKVERFRRWGSL
ncbi:MAG TPA: PIG-L deacetylase family protein [Chloroflexota bacterium]|nr:PIG-L deacetylase family protein [Chloroflexota bacterium]